MMRRALGAGVKIGEGMLRKGEETSKKLKGPDALKEIMRIASEDVSFGVGGIKAVGKGAGAAVKGAKAIGKAATQGAGKWTGAYKRPMDVGKVIAEEGFGNNPVGSKPYAGYSGKTTGTSVPRLTPSQQGAVTRMLKKEVGGFSVKRLSSDAENTSRFLASGAKEWLEKQPLAKLRSLQSSTDERIVAASKLGVETALKTFQGYRQLLNRAVSRFLK